MAGRGRDFTLRIVGDTKDAQSALGGMAGGVGKVMGAVAGGIGIATGVEAVIGKVIEFGQQSVEAASNLEQSMGAVDAVFGDAQGTIKAFGDTAAQSVGLSESAFQSGAANIGALLQNMGSSADEAAASAIDLTKVGADFAAQYGGTTTDALDAVQSALKGQFDPLEKYAVSLSAAQVNAKAVELGLISEGEQLDAAAKAQATLALITEQGASAQGAFARESDTLAGKQQRATASMEDAKATIGTALMPVMVLLADVIGKYLAPVLEDLAPLIGIVVDVLGAVLAPVLEIVGELIGLIVDILTGDWEGAWDHAIGVVEGFEKLFKVIINGVLTAWNALDWQIDWDVPDWVPGIGGRGIHIKDVFPDVKLLASGGIVRFPTLAMVGESGPEAVVPLGRGGMGATYNVTVNAGVGDPIEIGREVVAAIRSYERAAGPNWRTG